MTEETVPAPRPDVTTPGSRESLLARKNKLAEGTVEAGGETWLCRELTGSARAYVIGLQAAARIKGGIDLVGYQKGLLLHGLIDPASPVDARARLLRKDDVDAVMEAGAGFLDPILGKIEQLSGLAPDAEKVAEAGFLPIPSDASTSE